VADKAAHELGFLAKLVIAVALLLIVGGILWHGVTLETLRRIWDNMVERPSERMWFRFILQPTMAAIAAILHGLKDARSGRYSYLWAILRNSEERAGLLRQGLNATARIVLLGIVMDVIYQALVLGTFYPNEAVIVALLLAFIPYLIIRGLVARIAVRWHRSPSTPPIS
jgi:hypothetical protein